MSSDEDMPDDWVPYSKRPAWSDVVPLAQDDGDHPIVQIAYSDHCNCVPLSTTNIAVFHIQSDILFSTVRDVYDYFRAVVADRELSARAFGLTTDALQLNPANYTVWQYR